MAVSSSLPLITISFFLSILAGQAVRDFPKSNIISDINASAEPLGKYVLVATLYPSRAETWEGNCFKHTQGLVKYNEDRTLIFMEVQATDPTSLFCTESYVFQVGNNTVSATTFPASSSVTLSSVFPNQGIFADIDKYGVSVLLLSTYQLGGGDQKKESGIDIVKEIQETSEDIKWFADRVQQGSKI